MGEREAEAGGEQLLDVRAADIGSLLNLGNTKDLQARGEEVSIDR